MPDKSGEELSRRLAAYPREALTFFEEAFGHAATLSENVRRQVLDEMVVSLKRGARRLNGAVLRPITNLSERASEQVASVYSLVIGLLAESSVTPEEFVKRASGKIFSENQHDIATAIAAEICSLRPNIYGVVDRAKLAGEVIPSFDSMSVAVDVRIRFVEGMPTTTVPVALLNIDTDDDQKIFFQATIADLEEIVRRLNMCLNDAKRAENFELKHD